MFRNDRITPLGLSVLVLFVVLVGAFGSDAQASAVATLCPDPIGTASSSTPTVFYRWHLESMRLDDARTEPTLRCRYAAELPSAEYSGACLVFFTDPYGNLWAQVKERLKPNGVLLCKYLWNGTTDPAPDLRKSTGG